MPLLCKVRLLRSIYSLKTAVLGAVLSLFVAPQLAHADAHCCCLKKEGESAKCFKCKEDYTFYWWGWSKCNAEAVAGGFSSSYVSGRCCTYEPCSECPCSGGTAKVANIQWWHDKNFTGTTHERDLYQSDYGKCLRLVHNDAMKSIKFWGKPGQNLTLYDDPNCKTSDDWGVLSFPSGVSVVSLPKIGKRGPSEVSPKGAYTFHYHNGLPGKVSAIRINK